MSRKDIYVGKNGVGKSFILKVFSSIAYLYSINDHSPRHDVDTQKVIQDLINVNIGELSNGDKAYDGLLIRHFTSYQGKDESEQISQGDEDGAEDEVASVLKMGAKLLKALDSYYYIKIGETAKKFFDGTNVIYYSNSQFPSNENFYSERAASFHSSSVDVPFWMLLRQLPQMVDFEVKVWMNNSMGCANFTDVRKEISSERFKEHMKYTYRHIFNFYNGELFENILNNELFVQMERLNMEANNQKRKFPYVILKMGKMSVDDYLVLLMLKDCIKIFNFELLYKGIPYNKLNSGEKYLLTLNCLENVCQNQKRTLLIIDEPENSLHLDAQSEIAKQSERLQIVVATHSPAYAMSLMNELPNSFILHLLSRGDSKCLNEEIVEDNYLKNYSLDETAAEFFAYSPFLDEWDKVNLSINPDCLIDINDFYEKVGKLD